MPDVNPAPKPRAHGHGAYGTMKSKYTKKGMKSVNNRSVTNCFCTINTLYIYPSQRIKERDWEWPFLIGRGKERSATYTAPLQPYCKITEGSKN